MARADGIPPLSHANHLASLQAEPRSAKVLLTILYNHALPLIRYELTDEVTLIDGECPCGSAHTMVEIP